MMHFLWHFCYIYSVVCSDGMAYNNDANEHLTNVSIVIYMWPYPARYQFNIINENILFINFYGNVCRCAQFQLYYLCKGIYTNIRCSFENDHAVNFHSEGSY